MTDKPFYTLRPVMGEMKFSTERHSDRSVTKITWPVMGHEFVRILPKSKEETEQDDLADELVAKLLDDGIDDINRRVNATTATIAGFHEQQKALSSADIIASITKLMDEMPTKETIVVGMAFPEQPIVIKTDRENFTCMNRAGWENVRRLAIKTNYRDTYGITPFFADEDVTNRKGSEWHAREKKRIYSAIGDAFAKMAREPENHPAKP